MDDTAIIDITSYKQMIKNGVVLVDFSAPWCGPCRALEPIIHELEAEYSGKATVLNVNIDEAQELSAGLLVQSIPTIIVYKNGKEMDRFIGLQTADKLKTALNQALA